jgi:hypothetical protein
MRLKKLIIPKSVTQIGSQAFFGCDSLTIYCRATVIPDGWAESWNKEGYGEFVPVVWGYTGN